MPSSVDYADIQGLVRFGFGAMTEACYFLLHIKDAAAARAWLKTTHSQITTAEERRPTPKTALQVAFTHQGLEKMRVPSQVMEGFSAEFRCGMTGDESRSRRLGDTGANSPEGWDWGAGDQVPHA